MNGVESVGSAGFADHARHITGLSKGQSPAGQDERASRRPAGMEGALKLSGEFVRQTLTESGFIDIQAGGTEKIDTFIQSDPVEEQAAEASLEPAVAAAVAAHMGAQMASDINQTLRVLAHVDPARVAALLK